MPSFDLYGLFSKNNVLSPQPGMFDGVTDEVQKVPDEFKPYSWSVLTKELIDYAAKHINETEEIRTKSLREIREFIKSEFGIHSDIPDNYLLCFLRTKKFDIKKTVQLMRALSKFAESYRCIFERDDFDIVRRVVESKTMGFLPYRDAKGRAIVVLRSEWWKPDEIKADDVIFGVIASLQVAADNEVNQVTGYVVICDFKNLTLQQVICMSPWIIFGIQALQRCCPVLVKEFHVVHTPALLRTCWKVVKNVISEKIRNRITFYKSVHWESFHRRIPPTILPEELGGHLGPYSPEHWAGDVNKIEKRYKELVRLYLKRENPT